MKNDNEKIAPWLFKLIISLVSLALGAVTEHFTDLVNNIQTLLIWQ